MTTDEREKDFREALEIFLAAYGAQINPIIICDEYPSEAITSMIEVFMGSDGDNECCEFLL